MKSVLPTMRLL